jgi:transcriptional regulator with XRE-family HTH domain
MPDDNVVGNRIKECRRLRSYSQAELAEMIGIHDATVRRWEMGRQVPNIEMLHKLATALETTTGYLMGEIDTPKRFVTSPEARAYLTEYLSKKGLPELTEDELYALLPDYGLGVAGGPYPIFVDSNSVPLSESVPKFISEAIKKIRKARNYTQAQVASALRISEKRVRSWENGEIVPNAIELYQLSAAFDVPLVYLVGTDDPSVNVNGTATVYEHEKGEEQSVIFERGEGANKIRMVLPSTPETYAFLREQLGDVKS